MRQVDPPLRHRRKRCLFCRELFDPDPRTKGKQRHCSAAVCQEHRQRVNEKDWRKNNPDCLAEQYKQSREWHQARPEYSRLRREKDPMLVRRNRELTRENVRRQRERAMFDKSKLIMTQVIGNKRSYCYLSRGGKWLLTRLTKASPLSKCGGLGHNRGQFKRIANQKARLPAGRLYDLSSAFV
jgi:hypothetical protein